MSTWRLVIEDGASAGYGLAADEVQARRVGRGESAPTLRLYTYDRCALVGRFQTIESELRLDACRAEDVPYNRRPTGGGAIVMGPGQLGVALTLPGSTEDPHRRARELMARFSEGVVRGVGALGISAAFRGKNAVEVGGKKLAGLGVYRDGSGGLLYHASLLVDLDVAFMLRVLSTPFEKIGDKEIAAVSQRISTVRRELGRDVPLDEVRAAIARGYEETFGVTLELGRYDDGELEQTAALGAEKYRSHGWIHQRIEVPDRVGSARKKTDAGLLDVRVTAAGRMMKAVYVGGDFFAAEGAIADLEGLLRWHVADPDRVRETVTAAYGRHGDALDGLPMDALIETIVAAASRASEEGYGCFVNPRGGDA